MSARRDYAKKGKGSKKRTKTAKNHFWKISLLTLTCLVIALAYYARNDLQKIHLQTHTMAKKTEPVQIAKPKFEFYSQLPTKPKHAKKSPPPSNSQKDIYQIQLASFKLPEDAERLKAQLILDGYTANIKPFTLDKQKYLRVSIGPYQNLADANKALQSFHAENYEGLTRVG